MKKVLFVMYNALNEGGIQKVVMNIVDSLSGVFSFDILCFQDDIGSLEKAFASYGGRIIKVPVYYAGTSTIRKRLDFYLRGSRINEVVIDTLKKHGPYDIIHCHNAYEGGICLEAAEKMGVPIRIAHSHTNFVSSSNVIRKIYEKNYRKKIWNNATAMVGCSEKAAISLFGKYTDRTIIINNGVDTNKFDPAMYKSKREQNNKICLVQIATFSKNKNQIFSLQVLKQLRDQCTNSVLILIGRYSDVQSEMYYHEMKEYIQDNLLREAVIFLPADTDIPKVLSESDMLLFPSHEEGFPLVPLEAQAMGKKCLVSSTITREIDCGGCMFLDLSDGPKFWAQKILEYIKDRESDTECYDMTKFKNDTIMSEYRKLYGE